MEIDTSVAAQELARRELARRKLKHFIKYVFPGYKQRPHNQIIADAVDLCVSGKVERLMVFCPPQFGKSEIVSRKLPGYVLGKYPDKRIMLISYAATLAYNLSRDARNLVLSDSYQKLFGAMSSNETSVVIAEDSRSVHSWDIEGHRGGMVAAGIGGGIAGKPADFAIIDDPVKDDTEILSESVREQHFGWYWGVLHARLSPHAPVVLTMTRWGEDDLAGKLLKQASEVGEMWYVLRLTALAETDEEIQRWCELSGVDSEHYLTRETIDAF